VENYRPKASATINFVFSSARGIQCFHWNLYADNQFLVLVPFYPCFRNLYFYAIFSLYQTRGCQATGSGRARRDAAARAMQGWHAQRHLGHGEVSEPIVKVCCDTRNTYISHIFL